MSYNVGALNVFLVYQYVFERSYFLRGWKYKFDIEWKYVRVGCTQFIDMKYYVVDKLENLQSKQLVICWSFNRYLHKHLYLMPKILKSKISFYSTSVGPSKYHVILDDIKVIKLIYWSNDVATKRNFTFWAHSISPYKRIKRGVWAWNILKLQ